MRTIYKLALLLSAPALSLSAQITPGLTTPQIQAIINGASSGSTVTVAAGTYVLTAPLTGKCGVSITGPVVPLAPFSPGDGYTYLGYTPTATFQGNFTTTWIYTLSSCGTAQSVKYLAFNGGRPSPDGGGALYLPGNTSNVTISYNYFFGNQTINTNDGNAQDTFIWIGDNNPANNDQNITITYNRAGATGNCSNIMSNFSGSTYRGGSANSYGGYCAFVGIHAGATNLNILNNDIYYQEEGIKHFDGTSSSNFCNSCVFDYNDMSNIHRFGFESQIGPTPPEQWEFNTYHDPFVPFYGTFGLSNANGSSTQSTYANNNLLIDNISPLCCGQPSNEYTGEAHESWGYLSSANDESIQGYWASGVVNSYPRNSSIQNTAFCGQGTPPGDTKPLGMIWVNGNPQGEGSPVISGNTPSGANTYGGSGALPLCTQVASVAPTISPSSGTVPLNVTVTDAGNTSGAGVKGNTGVWCTTDGSTPTPGSGTAKYYASGSTINITSAANPLKCVGMYGAQNQPTSYAATYGFAPSSVVTGTYTSGSTPTAATPVLAPTSQAFSGTLSVSISDSTAGSTIYYTTDGSTPTTSSTVYTGALSLTTTTTVNAIAAAAGYLNSAIGSGTYTAGAPSLTGGHQGNSGSVNHLAVGAAAVQQTAIGQYSDGIDRPLPDAYGNTAVWSSSNGSVLQVDSSGMVSCLTTGTANSQVISSPGSVHFSPWTWTCTAALPAAPTGLQVIVVGN